ncbi:MAG: sigma-70 family RNA polymerase sigma factor [Saprospiraceae bacterium]|nr:sigma-70 family RNA polymerase sigma factor [Saprospiraceae bacterium]MCB9322010.1 sigma-70 family RNA polymerase sigma factor [Lewinellaceae bacterium]
MNTSQDIIPRILQGDTHIIESLYRESREPFVRWVQQKYNVQEDVAVELFQMAMVIFYDNVISGKLTEMKSSVSTYLFQIGRNKALEYHRQRRRTYGDDLRDTLAHYVTQETGTEHEEVEEEYFIMDQGMQLLGEPCRSLLFAFYVQNKSMEELAEEMNYKNADTVKNVKYKCLQRLRKLCDGLKGSNEEI